MTGMLRTIADLVALLRDPDARTAAMLEAALGAGELAAWLQARWRPAADAPRLAGRVRDLCQRLRGRGALARFALLNLLEPGQPLPLGDGLVLQRPSELESLFQQVPPDRRRALLTVLQRQVAEGFFAEWLRAGEFPDAARVLAVLEECQSRYPNEPLLLAYAVRWSHASTVGVPFAEVEIADPRELAARIAGSASGRQAGLEALRRGWLRTWLVATGRLDDPAALDRTLEDPRLPADYALEIVLRLLDPALPWPQPVCDPAALDFGWIRPEAIAERTLTVRAAGSGFLWGDARIEPLVAGVTLAPTTVQGPSSTLRLRVEPRGLPLSSRHAGQIVVRTAAGEVRVPWRFAVGAGRSLITARTLALIATVALVVVAWITVMRWHQPVTTPSSSNENEKIAQQVAKQYVDQMLTHCGSSSFIKEGNNRIWEFIGEVDAVCCHEPPQLIQNDPHGITWRGSIEVFSSKYRVYSPDIGWFKWEDGSLLFIEVYKKNGQWKAEGLNKISCSNIQEVHSSISNRSQ